MTHTTSIPHVGLHTNVHTNAPSHTRAHVYALPKTHCFEWNTVLIIEMEHDDATLETPHSHSARMKGFDVKTIPTNNPKERMRCENYTHK